MSESAASARVLLVDDEPSVLSSFAMLLEVAGFTVVAVASGQAALARLREEDFDALITDIRMPEMDGAELLVQARALKPALPALMVSGHEGYALPGFDGFLPKLEVSVDRFRDAVTAAIRKRQALAT